MRYMDKLLEYSGLLGEIFQGRSSYSLGGGSLESEKRKAVGHYVGETKHSWSPGSYHQCVRMCMC